MLIQVPELSLNKFTDGNETEKKEFVQLLFEGLTQFGFIIIKDHPIPLPLLEKAYELSENLFSLPKEIKENYICQAGSGQRGYTPFGKEHAKDNPYPDLKEFWHVGQFIESSDPYAKYFPKNVWPTEFDDFKNTFTQIYKDLENVGSLLLTALSEPLKTETHFLSKMMEKGNSILRLLHYPPLGPETEPNCVRAAAHEDINLITILVAATSSGLELLDRNNKWLPVETAKNNLIVDAGDMLARITNNVIPSTTHRVVNPVGENSSRYSMPFFIHPHPSVNLSCLDSCKDNSPTIPPDILSHDFLLQRLEEIGLTKS